MSKQAVKQEWGKDSLRGNISDILWEYEHGRLAYMEVVEKMAELLSSQKQQLLDRVREEVGKMRLNDSSHSEGKYYFTDEKGRENNRIIDDVLTVLKSMEEY